MTLSLRARWRPLTSLSHEPGQSRITGASKEHTPTVIMAGMSVPGSVRSVVCWSVDVDLTKVHLDKIDSDVFCKWKQYFSNEAIHLVVPHSCCSVNYVKRAERKVSIDVLFILLFLHWGAYVQTDHKDVNWVCQTGKHSSWTFLLRWCILSVICDCIVHVVW